MNVFNFLHKQVVFNVSGKVLTGYVYEVVLGGCFGTTHLKIRKGFDTYCVLCKDVTGVIDE